jgi:hypothetical protein
MIGQTRRFVLMVAGNSVTAMSAFSPDNHHYLIATRNSNGRVPLILPALAKLNARLPRFELFLPLDIIPLSELHAS